MNGKKATKNFIDIFKTTKLKKRNILKLSEWYFI